MLNNKKPIEKQVFGAFDSRPEDDEDLIIGRCGHKSLSASAYNQPEADAKGLKAKSDVSLHWSHLHIIIWLYSSITESY